MIITRSQFNSDEVAAHYDDLDRFYREIWGEHIHHGLWQSRGEPADEATRHLIAVVAAQARVQAGDRVCDVGSGYGGTARTLAREYAAEVTALTVSRAQHEHALSFDPGATNPTYLLRDSLGGLIRAIRTHSRPTRMVRYNTIVTLDTRQDGTPIVNERSRTLSPGAHPGCSRAESHTSSTSGKVGDVRRHAA
jgi:tocopherol O-methyltransferase